MNIKNLFSTKKYQKNISVSETKERYLIIGCFPKLYNLKYDNGSGLSPTVTICNKKSDLEKIFMSLHTWQHNMVMEEKVCSNPTVDANIYHKIYSLNFYIDNLSKYSEDIMGDKWYIKQDRYPYFSGSKGYYPDNKEPKLPPHTPESYSGYRNDIRETKESECPPYSYMSDIYKLKLHDGDYIGISVCENSEAALSYDRTLHNYNYINYEIVTFSSNLSFSKEKMSENIQSYYQKYENRLFDVPANCDFSTPQNAGFHEQQFILDKMEEEHNGIPAVKIVTMQWHLLQYKERTNSLIPVLL